MKIDTIKKEEIEFFLKNQEGCLEIKNIITQMKNSKYRLNRLDTSEENT